MAERRMLAKTIIDSDAFIEMPVSSQLLYFHLSMRADDDGFINNPKSIMRSIGCKDDDMNMLILKKFIIPFEKGIVVIKHWRIHNYIQKDRYIATKYQEERSMLEFDENNAYRMIKNKMDTECIQNVHTLYTQDSIGKDSIGKNSIDDKSKRFTPPTLDQVSEYVEEIKSQVDPQRFIDFYESKGWMVGRNKMKDWKAAVRTWQKSSFTKNRIEIVSDYPIKEVNISDNEADEIKRSLKSLGGNV